MVHRNASDEFARALAAKVEDGHFRIAWVPLKSAGAAESARFSEIGLVFSAVGNEVAGAL